MCPHAYTTTHTLAHNDKNEQASILAELTRRLLGFRPALLAAAAAAAELDCLSALAAAARDGGYCRPTLVEEPVLEIVGGARARVRAFALACLLPLLGQVGWRVGRGREGEGEGELQHDPTHP